MADKNKAHAPRPRKGKSSGPWLKDKSNLAKLGLLVGLLVALAVIIVVLYLPDDDNKRRPRPSPPIAEGPVPAPAPGPTSPPAPGPTSPQAPAPAPQDDQPPEDGPPGGEATPGDVAYPGVEGQTPQGPYGPGRPGEQDGPAQPDQKPKRPEDVSEWKRQDFYGARQEGDQRLIEAVGLLAQRAPGDTKVAENLAKLLAPLPKKDGSAEGSTTPYGPRFGGSDPKLIQALVAALGANGSDLSRTLLEQLLAGTLPTDDDKTAVEAAVNALVMYPSAKTDEILFRALSAAESIRPQPKGEIGADQLREMTLAAVSATASEGLRTKLAGYLIQPNTPPQQRDQLGGFLGVEHPDNVGAQLILYQSQQTPPETKAAFEQYFVGYSSAALARILRLPQAQPQPSEGYGNAPPTGRPGGGYPQRVPNPGTARGGDAFGEGSYGREYDGPGASRPNVPAVRPGFGPPGGPNVNPADARPPDPDAPFRRARQLWSPQTVAIVEGRLGEVTSLEEQARLALLAGTIPVDSTRSALWEVLHDRWEDGPEQLEAAGLATSLISDPGMLLTIKTLPRKRSTTSTTSRGGYQQPGDSYGQGNRFRPGGRDPAGQSPSATEGAVTAQDKARKVIEAQQAWMDTSESLVRAWCERFHAAGLAQAQAAQNPVAAPGKGESEARGPVKLHPQANVVSEYHLTWPGELGAKLSGIAAGPMEVHYIRIADKAKQTARLGFYRRQLRLDMDEIRPIERGGWLDKVQRVPKTDKGPIDKTDWRRSVDVLITSVEEEPEPNRQGEIDLVVQILSIEMKDPVREE